jgi:hypothetical protein
MAAVPRVELRPAVQALFWVLLLETLLGWAAAQWLPGVRGWRSLTLLAGARLLQTGAVLTTFRRAEGHLRSLGLGKDGLGPGVRGGVAWSLGFGAVVLAGFAALLAAGIDPLRLLRVRLGESPADIAAFFFVGGVVGPAAEEVVFRGVLYGFFRRWGVLAALGASTAVFALLHGGGGFTQIVGGLLFGVAYEREGRLTAPATLHVLGNTALFSLSLIP